jgi:hypothetical protein
MNFCASVMMRNDAKITSENPWRGFVLLSGILARKALPHFSALAEKAHKGQKGLCVSL